MAHNVSNISETAQRVSGASQEMSATTQETGAAIENIPNPRNELEENELQVSNPNFHALGVSSTTLERGLLEEITAVARLYRDRVDFSKIPTLK